MTVVYFDTSAYPKLLLDDEVGRDIVVELWETATVATSNRLTEAVGGRAGTLAIHHALTGADAVHLASAEALGTAVMATWDRRLGAAAAAVGLAVVPAA